MIRVKNKRKSKPEKNDIYIGRGSVLGNPFTHLEIDKTKAEFHCSSREESIFSYEKYNPSSPTHNPNNPILGLMQADTATLSDGIAVVSGIIQMNTTGLGSSGTKVYVDSTGSLVGGRPSTGAAIYVGVVAIQATKPLGGMIVVQTKGNGTWGALKDGLS